MFDIMMFPTFAWGNVLSLDLCPVRGPLSEILVEYPCVRGSLKQYNRFRDKSTTYLHTFLLRYDIIFSVNVSETSALQYSVFLTENNDSFNVYPNTNSQFCKHPVSPEWATLQADLHNNSWMSNFRDEPSMLKSPIYWQ